LIPEVTLKCGACGSTHTAKGDILNCCLDEWVSRKGFKRLRMDIEIHLEMAGGVIEESDRKDVSRFVMLSLRQVLGELGPNGPGGVDNELR